MLYAVDLGVKAGSAASGTSDEVRRVVVAGGVLQKVGYRVDRKTYSFDNRNDEARRIVVVHPRRADWELRAPAAGPDSDLAACRFEIDVAAGARAELEVVEVRAMQTNLEIGVLSADQIEVLVHQRLLDPAIEALLREVAAENVAVAELGSRASEAEAGRGALEADQKRIRDNLAALGDSAEEKDLRRTYATRLQDDESALAALAAKAGDLRAQAIARHAALRERLMQTSLEYEVR